MRCNDDMLVEAVCCCEGRYVLCVYRSCGGGNSAPSWAGEGAEVDGSEYMKIVENANLVSILRAL